MLPISSSSALSPGVTQLLPLASPSRRIADCEDSLARCETPGSAWRFIPGTPQSRNSVPGSPSRSAVKSGSKRVHAVRKDTLDPGLSLTCSTVSPQRGSSEGCERSIQQLGSLCSGVESASPLYQTQERLSSAISGFGRPALSAASDFSLQRLGAENSGFAKRDKRIKQQLPSEQIDCRPHTTPVLRGSPSSSAIPSAINLPPPGRTNSSLPLQWRQKCEQEDTQDTSVPLMVTRIHAYPGLVSGASGHIRRTQAERALPEVDQFRVDVTLLPHMPIEPQKQSPLSRPHGGVKMGGKLLTSSNTMPTLGNISAPPPMLLKGKSAQALSSKLALSNKVE